MLKSRKLTIAISCIYVGLLAPLVVVLAVSFSPSEQFTISWTEPSLRWYAAFFNRELFSSALFGVSLPIGLLSATVATLLGGTAAVALVRYDFRGRGIVMSLVMLPLLIPAILLGAALYLFYARIGIGATVVSLAIGHVLIGIPYVVRLVSAGLSGVDRAMEEAAISLGCSPFSAFLKVVVPSIRGSLISGWVFAFIISFSDINVALFLAGPSTQTIPLQIFSEVQWGGDPTIAAASAIQILLVGLLLTAMQHFFRVRLSFR